MYQTYLLISSNKPTTRLILYLIAAYRKTNAIIKQLFRHLLFRQNCYVFQLENLRSKSLNVYSILITVTELYVLLYINTGERNINDASVIRNYFKLTDFLLQRVLQIPDLTFVCLRNICDNNIKMSFIDKSHQMKQTL